MTSDTLTQTEYVTVAEVATNLRLSKMTVYRMCAEGTLPSIRTGRGRTIRIPRDAYLRYKASLRGYREPITIGPGQTSITDLTA